MSLPDRGGRGQPRRKVLQTVHTRAAVQSVLGPICGVKKVPFPPDPRLAANARGMWLSCARELENQGFRPLACDANFGRVVRCPWGLYGLDDQGTPCKRPGCPSCHGMQTALAVERVLRVIGDQGTAKLRLIRKARTVTTEELDSALKEPPPRVCNGYMRQVSVERIGPDDWTVTTSYLVLGGPAGSKIKPHPMAVARAVARMRPYPAAHLELPPALLLDTLRRLAGKRLSSCAGVFQIPTQERPVAPRYARAARTLSDCTPTFLPKPTWGEKPAVEVEPVPELGPSGDDGPAQILINESFKVIEIEIEKTSHLSHAEMLAELESRQLEWVPGYEAWLEMMEDYWDEYWVAVGEEGAIEYVTADDVAYQAEMDDFVHMEHVEAMFDEEVLRSEKRCNRDGGDDPSLDVRLQAMIEEELDVELEPTIWRGREAPDANRPAEQ